VVDTNLALFSSLSIWKQDRDFVKENMSRFGKGGYFYKDLKHQLEIGRESGVQNHNSLKEESDYSIL